MEAVEVPEVGRAVEPFLRNAGVKMSENCF